MIYYGSSLLNPNASGDVIGSHDYGRSEITCMTSDDV